MNANKTKETFPSAQFTTPRGFTYHYILVHPSSSTASKPPILILHGFPSIPTDFSHQTIYLRHLGHLIIAPYLLGYYPTSTPPDAADYRLKLICQDLIALLDTLNIQNVIGLGHDWGATLLSRLEYYYPCRITKLIYLSIAPVPFGQEFNLDKVNEMTRQMTGQAMFGYQKFFMDNLENGRAARLLAERHDRMNMLMFAYDSVRLWKEYFCAIDGLEKWLEGDVEAAMFEGVTENMLLQRKETFKPSGGNGDHVKSMPGYAGSLNWYVSHNHNLNVSDEQSERAEWQEYKIDKDVLLVLGENDPASPPDTHVGMAQAYVKNTSKQLTVTRLEAGHFLMMQQARELNATVKDFLGQ